MKLLIAIIMIALIVAFQVATAQDDMEGMPDLGGMDFGDMEGMDGMDFGDMGGMGGGMEGMEGMDMEALQEMMAAQGGGMGGMGGMPPRKEYHAVTSDIKYIQCQACKVLAKHALSAVNQLRSKYSEKVKVTEDAIDDLLEDICDTSKSAGIWISEYDMVESDDGTAISLKRQSGPGHCQEECKTLEKACKNVYEDVGTDLVELLYLNKLDKDQLVDTLCTKKLSKRMKGTCKKPVPVVKSTRESNGDNFQPKTKSEIEMDEISRKMRASMPNGMNMMTRDPNEL